MRTLLIAMYALGCLAGCRSEGPTVEGNWIYKSDDGAWALALDISGDEYSSALMLATSGTSVNAQVEKGTYTMTDSALLLRPREWSCTGALPSYAVQYRLSGPTMVVTSNANIWVFERNTSGGPTSGLMLTTGCDPLGDFVPMGLGPAGN
jgi:hypothetical protein